MHSLAAVDLNLLVALHALLEERSVTAAARRIGLSQPAMSHALARLRDHFGDPLLVRSGRAMVPTPRALGLQLQCRPVVQDLEALLSPRPPKPDAFRTGVRVVCDDGVGTTVLPPVLARCLREAPGIEVDVLARGAPGRKRLVRTGAADLAIGHFSGAGMDLRRDTLASDPWVSVLRRSHPALHGDWSPEAWAALHHLIVSPTGGRRGDVDRALSAVGLERRVPVAVPHFTTALKVVAVSDLVLTLPARFAAHAQQAGLVSRRPPLPLAPLELAMLWHERTSHDPAHRWFRDLVTAAVADPDSDSP